MILVVELAGARPTGQVIADAWVITTCPQQAAVQTVRFGEMYSESAQGTDAVLITNVSRSENASAPAQFDKPRVVGEEVLEPLDGLVDEERARVIGEIG